MKKRPVLKAALVVFAIVISTLAVYAIPNQPPAPYPGACGYQAYVASPPYYWISANMSWSQCQAALPGMIANAQSQGFTVTEAYCRPAKWCA